MFKRYLKDTTGNVAMMFVVSVMAVLAGVGAAVDYTAISSKKNSYQNLADAAVLAAARSGETNKAKLKLIASAYIADVNATGDTLKTKLTFSKKGHIRVTVQGNYKPFIMGMFGNKNNEVAAAAEAPLPSSAPVNIVFVLDTTGSMSGAKMASLKSAANDLLDELEKFDGDSVKVSVVPFAQYVNVGLSRRNEIWRDVQDDTVTPLPDSCYYPVIGSTNCRMVNTPYIPARPAVPPGTCYNDGVPYSCGGSAARPAVPAGRREVCDNVYSPTQVCTPRENRDTWLGCVGSRSAPWNARAKYSGKKIPGLMDTSCGKEILPLTTDVAAAKAKVASLSASGNTYLPAGLAWGLRALTPSKPLTEANAKFKKNRRSVMILVTDGANTLSQFGQIHVGDSNANYDPLQANNLSKKLCTNINNKNIELFSIAYEMSDITAKNILRGCASKPDMFFDARDAAQLKSAFENIGDSLIKIRLTN